MKKFITCFTLLASISAFSSEVKVLEISARDARGSIYTSFEVNLQDSTAGVSAIVRERVGGNNPYTVSNRFEALIPELSLNGNNLEFNKDGVSVLCGTMGVTRIFKVPTLKLSGKCVFETKKISGRAVISLIAK